MMLYFFIGIETQISFIMNNKVLMSSLIPKYNFNICKNEICNEESLIKNEKLNKLNDELEQLKSETGFGEVTEKYEIEEYETKIKKLQQKINDYKKDMKSHNQNLNKDE
jgi:predicted RNase H-like nuclease (RuvC/YqgF family)